MPLIHSKTPKAFKKNIETEMKHGKPQKQAVAIAYSEKRKAEHHKAHGGEMCAHGGKLHCNVGCYDDGGQVAQNDGSKETLGTAIGYPGSPKPKPTQQPKMMAEGGSVDSWTKRSDNEKGINKAAGSGGRSEAGAALHPAFSVAEDIDKDVAKRKHHKVLGEMKAMKKPHGNYAHGGEVGPLKQGNWAANEKEPHKLAGGGEIEDGEHQMNEELHMAIGSELMDALERKDKKGIMEALKAAVMECMNGEYK
jgi:hypothetical protein